MATVKTYDSRCYDLAELFLSDCPDLNNERAKHSLALEIQQVIEDEIDFMRQGIFNTEATGECNRSWRDPDFEYDQMRDGD